jgi:hypothetical protein
LSLRGNGDEFSTTGLERTPIAALTSQGVLAGGVRDKIADVIKLPQSDIQTA